MEKIFCSRDHLKERETKDSSLLLVEATGDSEVDSNPNKAYIFIADDDAESCSYDTSDCSCVDEDFNGCEEEAEGDVVDDHHHHGSCEEQEEDGHVRDDQSWTGKRVKLQMNKKSCVSVESTSESLNEMEKNRLFWEACLAS